MHVCIHLSLSLSLYIYIYICTKSAAQRKRQPLHACTTQGRRTINDRSNQHCIVTTIWHTTQDCAPPLKGARHSRQLVLYGALCVLYTYVKISCIMLQCGILLIYIYIYISLRIYIYIYIYVLQCYIMYIYIYIYLYT